MTVVSDETVTGSVLCSKISKVRPLIGPIEQLGTEVYQREITFNS